MLYDTVPTIVKLTKAQYDALDPADKNNDTIYFITDVNGDGQSFQPVIYSGEEREIGVWTDGKPLYEKTIAKSQSLAFSSQTVVEDLTSLNIDTFVGFSSSSFEADGNTILGDAATYMLYDETAKSLKGMQRYSERAIAGFLITKFRYTKTTDTAGSGTWTPQGVPAIHYSEEEQVVGTWINGKTLYARTFVNENLSKNTIGSYDVYTVGTFDINAEMAFFITGALYETGDQRYFTLPYERSYSSTQKVYQELYTDAAGKLYVIVSSIRSSGFNFSKAYITAYYTKIS